MVFQTGPAKVPLKLISIVIVSKDEPQLAQTLRVVATQAAALGPDWELIVVDASGGRLDHVRAANPYVRWLDYEPVSSTRASIPAQRNVGVREARGEIVVFTDSGCQPQPGWLSKLLFPIQLEGEDVCAGRTLGRGLDVYDADGASPDTYLAECPTINMAFRRRAFEAIGGFDESFEYGSDVDFTWRLVDAGVRLRSAPEAVLTTDWGTRRRQLRRAWLYGRARARLYRKHRNRLRTCWRTDPAPFAYAAFLVGLPLTLVFPLYPALLVVPAVRNRRTGALLTVADHLTLGAGFLRELVHR
jgi:cellulose synthase/poly-beta-1,6-N-acetylglucosamine synthase-like glycosyltransferase